MQCFILALVLLCIVSPQIEFPAHLFVCYEEFIFHSALYCNPPWTGFHCRQIKLWFNSFPCRMSLGNIQSSHCKYSLSTDIMKISFRVFWDFLFPDIYAPTLSLLFVFFTALLAPSDTCVPSLLRIFVLGGEGCVW